MLISFLGFEKRQNKFVTDGHPDGRTDEQPDGQRQTYIPPPSAGDNNRCNNTHLLGTCSLQLSPLVLPSWALPGPCLLPRFCFSSSFLLVFQYSGSFFFGMLFLSPIFLQVFFDHFPEKYNNFHDKQYSI